jgi:hypothetical protein
MAFHRIPFRGGHSSKKYTHNSPIFDERPSSGYSPNALNGSFSSNTFTYAAFAFAAKKSLTVTEAVY